MCLNAYFKSHQLRKNELTSSMWLGDQYISKYNISVQTGLASYTPHASSIAEMREAGFRSIVPELLQLLLESRVNQRKANNHIAVGDLHH